MRAAVAADSGSIDSGIRIGSTGVNASDVALFACAGALGPLFDGDGSIESGSLIGE